MGFRLACVSLGVLSLLALRAGADEAGLASIPPGPYRLEMRVAAKAKLPWFGRAETLTASISRVEIEHEDGGLVQEQRVCEVRDEVHSRWRGITYPAAFIESLPTTRVRPLLTPTREGLAYHADLGREWLGTVPAESLPRRADDPRVIDSDGDGRPGVTLRLRLVTGEAELLVAQRSRAVLRGHVVSPGRVIGRVEIREFAQTVLEAYPHFLRFTPDIRYDVERSTFELVRDDAADCPTRARGAQSVAVNPSEDPARAPR